MAHRGAAARLTSEAAPPGAPLAIEAVYREHHAFVWRNARRLGCAADLVDDVVHEVFLVAQRKLADFEGRSHLRTWLFAITHRVVQHLQRTRARDARRFVPLGEEHGGSFDPHRSTEARSTLLELLSRLSEPQRIVFILVELEGMTSAEIAEELGIPCGTVDSRLRAARQRLTQCLEQDRSKERSQYP